MIIHLIIKGDQLRLHVVTGFKREKNVVNTNCTAEETKFKKKILTAHLVRNYSKCYKWIHFPALKWQLGMGSLQFGACVSHSKAASHPRSPLIIAHPLCPTYTTVWTAQQLRCQRNHTPSQWPDCKCILSLHHFIPDMTGDDIWSCHTVHTDFAH